MKPSAVLLIDLENFYCSREDYCRNVPAPNYDRTRFAADLDRLLGFARSMTVDRATGSELPFTVKRAYADFNAAKPPVGGPPQYYLRQLPDELLSQGVEPVQVFRLSRGGNGRGSKNAADMRMAMDATALVATGGHVEHFVLVTGDADFIPVILELKRHGHTVSVIGVTGATSPKIQRFVDNFELFEDLLAAEEVEAQSGELTLTTDGFGQVAAAVRRLLARTHVLRFAAVKPLLSKELGHPFDPGLFGCDTTGDFLRNHQAALGIVIRQGQHDSEISLQGTPLSNGNGSRITPRPTARPEKPPAAKAGPEPHTAVHYRQLLAAPRGAAADREGKVFSVPWPALVWACDAIVPLLIPPTGEPTHTTRLQPKLVAAAKLVPDPDLVKHAQMFYPTLRAGLPVQGADGVYALPQDVTSAQIRRSVLGYVGFVLKCRLAEVGIAGEVRPDQLAAVFDPGPALEQATAEFATALTDPTDQHLSVPTSKAAPAPKPAGAEELHTPTGYLKLLKNGGEKGSETESFKVLPVPWVSVERICADCFEVLHSAGGPVAREHLTARLIEGGKELHAEKYDQHVRRVLGILRLSGEVNEGNGTISLSPEVTSGHDLRSRALSFLLQLLQLRLEEREVYEPIRPHVFVAALEAGPLSDQLLEEVAPAIAWLYRPVGEDQPPSETDLQHDVPTPADVPGEPPASTAPEPDSGIGVVAPEPSLADRLESAVLRPPEGPAGTEPAAVAEPGWEGDEFGCLIPELDSARPADPSVCPDPEQTTALARIDPQESTDSPDSEIGEVDVAQLTTEAIAASAEPPQSFARGIGAVPEVPVAEPVQVPERAGEAEPIAEAPLVAVPVPESFAHDELPHPVPVADWLSNGDPLFDVLDDAEHPVVLPEPAPAPLPVESPAPAAAASPRGRSVPPPLPLLSLDDDAPGEVDRMTASSPPARRIVPPPLPPLPPPEPA
jgi:uncharacterized LabA/DUF88 family protein